MKPAPKKPSLQKTPARKKPARKSAATWDILTALLLGLRGLSCLCFGLIFVNPNLPLNPFPPGTPVAPLAVSLPTATAISAASPTSAVPTFPPEWTATFTPNPNETPTAQPQASATETVGAPPATAAAAPPAPPPPPPAATSHADHSERLSGQHADRLSITLYGKARCGATMETMAQPPLVLSLVSDL